MGVEPPHWALTPLTLSASLHVTQLVAAPKVPVFFTSPLLHSHVCVLEHCAPPVPQSPPPDCSHSTHWLAAEQTCVEGVVAQSAMPLQPTHVLVTLEHTGVAPPHWEPPTLHRTHEV